MDDVKWMLYGMDWSAYAPTENRLLTVEVNNVDVAIDDNAREQLSQINPLVEPLSFGIDICLRALE